MKNDKLAKIIGAIILILAIIGGSIYAISNFTKAVPEIPEGEPIITEDPTEPPTIMGIVNTDRSNVYKEPYIDSHVFKQLNIGTHVEIMELKILDTVPWGLSDYGWINMKYITIYMEDYRMTE